MIYNGYMQGLLKYIRSTFNYTHDIDTKNDAVNPKLDLLDKSMYNVFVTDITIPGCEHLTEEYISLAQKAFNEWSLALNNKIKFKVIRSLQGADIKIYWIKSKREYLARQNWDGNTILPMIVLNIGIMNIQEEAYSKKEVYHLLLHEIGHILKLGHSPISEDVMSCSAVWTAKLSENDKFVLNLIYSLGSRKSYLENIDVIKKQVKEYLKKSSKTQQKPTNPPVVIRKTDSVNLIDKLTEIEYVARYNLTMQHIGLSDELKDKLLKRDLTNNDKS